VSFGHANRRLILAETNGYHVVKLEENEVWEFHDFFLQHTT